MKESKDLLDWNNCMAIRAIGALSVMIGHILPDQTPVIIHRLFPGYLWVGIFFLCSGYGLRLAERKKDYLNGFLKKKLFAIYFPYVIAELIYIHGSFSVRNFLRCFGFVPYNKALWYVVELMGIYLIYYLARSWMGKIKNITWFVIYMFFLAGAVLLDYFEDIGTCWYLSTFAFVLGWCVVDIKEKFEKVQISKATKFLSVIQFVLVYASIDLIELIDVRGIPVNYCITAIEMVAVVLFCLMMVTISNGMNYSGRILHVMGECSYYIYLLHMPVYNLCGNFLPRWGQFYLTIILTCLLAYLWVILDKSIKGIWTNCVLRH